MSLQEINSTLHSSGEKIKKISSRILNNVNRCKPVDFGEIGSNCWGTISTEIEEIFLNRICEITRYAYNKNTPLANNKQSLFLILEKIFTDTVTDFNNEQQSDLGEINKEERHSSFITSVTREKIRKFSNNLLIYIFSCYITSASGGINDSSDSLKANLTDIKFLSKYWGDIDSQVENNFLTEVIKDIDVVPASGGLSDLVAASGGLSNIPSKEEMYLYMEKIFIKTKISFLLQ